MVSPFRRRGISFKVSPSSALSVNSDLRDERYAGSSTRGDIGTFSGTSNTRGRPDERGEDYGSTSRGPIMAIGVRDRGVDPVPHIPPTQSRAEAQSFEDWYEDFATKYYDQYLNSQMFGGIDPADQAAIDQEFALRQKEAALAQAELDGDFKEAERLRGEIAANKAAMAAGIQHTNVMANPVFEKALAFARQINERNAPVVRVNTAEEMGDIGEAYQGADQRTIDTSNLIGSGDAALEAARKIAGADQDLYLQQAFRRGDSSAKIIAATEEAGVADTDYIAKRFRREMIEFEGSDKQHWADEDRRIAEMFEDLGRRKEGLAIAAERDKLQKANAERGLYESDFDFEKPDPFTLGSNAAMDLIAQYTRNEPPHVTAKLQGVLSELFTGEFFVRGQYTPEAVRAFFNEEIDPENQPGVTRADAAFLTSGQVDTLAQAIGAYGSVSSKANEPAPSTRSGSYGTGGQAPNNRDHAGDTTGPYAARRAFVTNIAPQIMEEYGLRDGGGQVRPLSMAPGGDRAENSDHYSGGAFDFTGSEAAMQNAAKELAKLPYVSFARVHGDPRHLHVSFNIGYFS